MLVVAPVTVLSLGLVPRHATIVDRQTVGSNYTFVIAGGGIAGLTIADRLTEDPSVSSLVLEAGPFDKGEDGILIPGAYAPYLYFWPNLVTVPQAGLNNRSIGTVCAKVVGGGSAINAMVFLRGDEGDYDAWSSLGNPGWRWKGLLPFFLKSENFTRPDLTFARAGNISWDDSFRGNSGLVQNSYPNYFFPCSANWWNAAKSISLEPVKDPSSGDKQGIFWIPTVLNATTMTRSYARRNHDDRVIASRPNYHVLASNAVTKVLFRGKQAVGVNYVPSGGGSSSTVYASNEVILAAGCLHTPQLLQLSGIGPPKLLRKFGISIVVDLPSAGKNLQDQPTLTVPYTSNPASVGANLEPNSGTLLSNATYNAEQRALYDSAGKGPHTIVSTLSTNIGSLSLRGATAAYKQIVAQARARTPADSLPADVEPTILEGYKAQRSLILQQFENSTVGVGAIHWGTADSAVIYHEKPLSRGSVAINSTDPLVDPLIYYMTVTDPIDLQVYTALFRKHRQIFSAPAMRALDPVEASPFGAQLVTEDEIAGVMRDQINPSNAHQCCTAAMMPRELGGVASSEQKVYGVAWLRVADISFWPMQIAAAPTATMYASAEKVGVPPKPLGFFPDLFLLVTGTQPRSLWLRTPCRTMTDCGAAIACRCH
ncbi:GMC oxidoreductase-domain-containing protein [Lasiosphaeria ovina]|uniref:GMC oxidoreductase-domain-containing protein n=1 Tax=Lasiosphaeria ovina TaxID=92902 RepID=A0AAE0MZG2_9PEZI|nr:GMC oxidoreductase-domain-containing protein [Lasiosphaeria ovina]